MAFEISHHTQPLCQVSTKSVDHLREKITKLSTSKDDHRQFNFRNLPEWFVTFFASVNSARLVSIYTKVTLFPKLIEEFVPGLCFVWFLWDSRDARMTPFFKTNVQLFGFWMNAGENFYCNLWKSCFRTSLTVVISIVFAPLPSFRIPLTIKFRVYFAAPPRTSQFHISHVSVKMYVYLNMWALVRLLWLFMSSEGGHCPNDQPKNCNCTFFSKRSSLATYIVDCIAMDNEQVPRGIPSNTVILYVVFFVI